MPKKIDKLQILSDVLNAAFRGDKVIVGTTRLKINKTDDGKTYTSFVPTPQILTAHGAKKDGKNLSENVLAANSIKVGRDITIKRHDKNFIVRTQSGELLLPNISNSDIGFIWFALGAIYDNGSKDIMRVAGNLSHQLKTKELREMAKMVAKYGMVMKEKKDKYESAIEQLQELGIQPKRLVAYIQKQQKENG